MNAKRTQATATARLPRADRRAWYVLARRLMLVLTLILLFAFAQLPVERPALAPRQGPSISDARSWGYQLQNVALRSIADGTDVLVVDYSRDGSEARVLRPGEIEQLRTRADGSRRIVLAYLSIGEAETYRYYWNKRWRPGQPTWLGQENPEWKGNFSVRYWEAGWRSTIMRPQITLLDRIREAWQPASRAYLDRIIEAGFDGVYLDRIDAFDEWASERQTAQTDMVEFVTAISNYAKRRRPGFYVVAQNGEELLRLPDYRRVIDAVAKEDLVFGVGGDGLPNTPGDIRRSIVELNRLKADGRPVFVVEYLNDPTKRAEAQRQLAGLGYILHFAERDLRSPPEP